MNQRGEKPPVVSVGRAGEKPPVVGVSQAGDKPREVRKNVFFVELPDGSELNIRTLPAMSAPEPKVSDVDVALYGEPASKGWGANGVTTVHRVPEIKSYYALVKAMDDRIFIFFTWNAHYCTIDRKTGAILSSGDGDDVLELYDQLVPLKLDLPSSLGIRSPPPAGQASRT